MISRNQALVLIREHVKNENIVKHMLALEAVMGALAYRLKAENEDEWAMAGLLHDGDYCEEVLPEKQGVQITIWAKEKGYDISDNVAQCMAAHNPATGVAPQNKMDWAIFCADSLTGLIVATALVRPDKKLKSVKIKSVMKKFKDKAFAKGTRREDIQKCEEKLGISLKEFVNISLEAMKKISEELGL